MTDLIYAKQIFLNIYPDKLLADQIIEYITNNNNKISKLIKLCKKGKKSRVCKQNAFDKLCLAFAYLPLTKAKYSELGIEDEIFYDTMSDIKIWIDDYKQFNNNEYGLGELNWIFLHLHCLIFKLGRLQFQLSNYFISPWYNKNGISIKLGDKCLNLHIPRGEKLDIGACQQSFAKAKEFFPKFFPSYPTNIFECYSWIFYNGNANYMTPQSNLIKFSNMFEISSHCEHPSEALKYIFGINKSNKELIKNKRKYGYYYDLSAVKPLTSLQKQAKEYIMNGGKLGHAKGQIILNN